MKPVIVLGSGYSGSGAIFDYLSGRPDVAVAFHGREFRLVQDPGGLNELDWALTDGFTPNRANAAIREFQDFAERLARSKSANPPGFGFADVSTAFRSAVERFLYQITELQYRGLPFCELAKSSARRSLYVRSRRLAANAMGRISRDGLVALPVNAETFRRCQQEFISDLLAEYSDPHGCGFIAVNQAGSFWHPVSSTTCFRSRAVVVVTRDPRDIFTELGRRGYAYPGQSANEFCSWYSNVMSRIDREEWEAEVVTHVRFEDFVRQYDHEKARLDRAIGLATDIASTYDPRASEKNIGKWESELTPLELATIERALAKYLD